MGHKEDMQGAAFIAEITRRAGHDDHGGVQELIDATEQEGSLRNAVAALAGFAAIILKHSAPDQWEDLLTKVAMECEVESAFDDE